MKVIIFAVLFAALAAHGAVIFTQTFNENAAIPDGNPVGAFFTETFSQDPNTGDTVSGLSVNLNLSFGYNGDLYAYLTSPSGVMVTLLNQPGVGGGDAFGYGGSGLNITLSDAGISGIQTAPETDGVVLAGTYQAANSLAGFNGSPGNGAWTLFVADLSSGGGTSQLNSWSLNFSAVPEPWAWGLISGMSLLGIYGLHQWRENHRRRLKLEHPQKIREPAV